MKRIAIAILCIFLHSQLIVANADDVGNKTNGSPSSSEDASLTKVVKKPDALVLDDEVLSSITSHLSSIDAKEAGLNEIRDVSNTLTYMTSMLRGSISDHDIVPGMKDSIESFFAEMLKALSALKEIEGFIKEAEFSPNSDSGVTTSNQENSISDRLNISKDIEIYRKLTFETDTSGSSRSTDEDSGKFYSNNYSHSSRNHWKNQHYFFHDFTRFSKKMKDKFHSSRHNFYSHRGTGGENRRRLNEETEECKVQKPYEYKVERCRILVKCAKDYSMYDLYVYMYGDDIDFDNGGIDDLEKITFFQSDEVLTTKLETIHNVTTEINELDDDEISDKCDELLQEFYRFNEKYAGIHAAGLTFGKWQGGTVNSVCRESDTTKNLSLESILRIRQNFYHGGQFEMPATDEFVDSYLNLFKFPSKVSNDKMIYYYASEEKNFDDHEKEANACGGHLASIQNDDDDKAVLDLQGKNYAFIGGRLGKKGGRLGNEWTWTSREPWVYVPNQNWINEYQSLGQQNCVHLWPIAALRWHDIECSNKLAAIYQLPIDSKCIAYPTPEPRTVDIFEDFVFNGAEVLAEKIDEKEGKIFSKSETSRNPFIRNNNKLCIPLSTEDSVSRDKYGQPSGTKLDTFFKYKDLPGTVDLTDKKFDDTLKLFLMRTIASGKETIEDFKEAFVDTIKKDEDNDEYEKRIDRLFGPDMPRDLSAFESKCKEGFKGENNGFGTRCDDLWFLAKFIVDNDTNGYQKIDEEGFFLDKITAMVYGDEKSIGDVYQYAAKLQNDERKDDLQGVPGYCCLEAPFEVGDYWGEKYSCTHDRGNKKGSYKKKKDDEKKEDYGYCAKLAPYTAGFSEAACDVFSGTWCPQPRNCKLLVDGIIDLKSKASDKTDRIAFFEYLDAAPKVDNDENPEQCGDLREYLEFDYDYPDDQHIIDNVKHVQCREDFENINDYATGTNGPGEGDEEDEELFIDDKVKTVANVEYRAADIARAWRGTNFALRKSMELIDFKKEMFENSELFCLAYVSAKPGTAAGCAATFVGGFSLIKSIWFAMKVGIDISEHTYNEVISVTEYDGWVEDYMKSTYQNVITNHKNIITTFKSTRQLKKQLGDITDILDDIAEGLEALKDAVEDPGDDRRLAEKCGKETRCNKSPNTCSCGDLFYNCDCTANYTHIMKQELAGCDGQDSDGDKYIDACEDRYAPTIIFSDPAVFVNFTDLKVLRYSKTIFANKKHAENLLKYSAFADDDCQDGKKNSDGTKIITMEIEHVEGTICEDTKYSLTPVQSITSCANHTIKDKTLKDVKFENPMRGRTENVTLNLDEEAPNVTCGFHNIHQMNIVQDKTLLHPETLFHYDGKGLQNSNFFYKVSDNCNTAVDVEIIVESNHLERDDDNGNFVKVKKLGFNEQTKFYYSADVCKYSGPWCEVDDSIDLNVRHYQIKVIATDSAGHAGMDKCQIIIVPRCKKEDKGCKTSNNKKPYHNYYKRDYLLELISQSDIRYDVSITTSQWDFNLKTRADKTRSPATAKSAKSAKPRKSNFNQASAGARNGLRTGSPQKSPTLTRKIPQTVARPRLQDDFTIRKTGSGGDEKCVGIYSESAKLQACDEDDSTQKWSFEGGSNAMSGIYRGKFINKSNGECLDVNTSNNSVGTRKCDGRRNQMWEYDDNLGRLKNTAALCLTENMYSFIEAYFCRHDIPTQKFKIL